MKKYKEFLERIEKEKKYILTLDETDLDADKEIKITIPYPEANHEERQNDDVWLKSVAEIVVRRGEIEEDNRKIISIAYKYFRKTFKDNNLNCEKIWFGQHIHPGDTYTYFVNFYGKESDLEKISKYYGISDDDYIHHIRFPNSHDIKISELWYSI